MLIKRLPGWAIPEREATSEDVYLNRRRFMTGVTGAGLALTAAAGPATAQDRIFSDANAYDSGLYPVERNPAYVLDRAITDEVEATTYNNFYEFGSHKKIWRAAQALETRPWMVTIDGMVEEKIEIDFWDLVQKMPLEERLYRHRCVETWAMAVPWSGFAMKALVDYARPLGSARYVRMATFENSRQAPGQRQFWYPWPYIEGLTMAEATNELAFIATGLYGRDMPKQNGAPLRLAVPWKYGFKSTKSIVRFTFTEERPVSFWEEVGPSEYGFWANVNPDVPHPRWSQANERMLGTGEEFPTQIYNGYGEFVAHLYADLQDEPLFM